MIKRLLIGALISFSNFVFAEVTAVSHNIVPQFFKNGFSYENYKLCKKQLQYCYYQRLDRHCEFNYYRQEPCMQLIKLADFLESSPEDVSLSPEAPTYYLISVYKNGHPDSYPYLLSHSGDLIKN